MPIQVHLIAIPAVPYWNEWPADRPMSLLAQDAQGIARRIRKGVNLQREQVRYTLLCNQIESLALQLAGDNEEIKRGRWISKPAKLYLDLIERLQQTSISSAATRFLGRSFFAPGDEVSGERMRFANLKAPELALSLDDKRGELFAKLALIKAKFYEEAEHAEAAVVEVVSMAPLSPPK